MPAMAGFFTTMSAKHDPLVAQRAIASPNRPNHQLRRSITEQSPPFRQSRVHLYLHRKDRDRDDRSSLSTGPYARGSLEFPRAGSMTPGALADTNIASRMAEDMPSVDEAGIVPQRLLNKDEMAREQQEKAAAATASLRKSLVELNTFSNATIARLDETYSSVLQRLGSLQSTVVAMKELAAMSQEINESFTNESRALVGEIEAQLGIYDQTADQKKRIQDLQARIHAGRDKVEALSKRVDVVRGRIESWEKADKDWQERTRRRLKATWIIISVVAFALMLLFVGSQYAPSSVDISRPADFAASGVQEGRPPIESLVENGSKSDTAVADEVRAALTRRRGEGATEQEALRVFDEL